MTSPIPRGTTIADLFRFLERPARHRDTPTRSRITRRTASTSLRAEIPGVDPQRDIGVAVHGDLLTLRLLDRAPARGCRRERDHGDLRGGILELRVPALEAAPSRRASIELGKS